MKTVLVSISRIVVLAVIAVSGGADASAAQEPRMATQEVFVNSDLERYLRILQVAGEAEGYPWSIRGFSPAEIARISSSAGRHPWADRYSLGMPGGRGPELSKVSVGTRLTYNSAFPYGVNDGPVWVGRGLTTALDASFVAAYGPLSLRAAPVVFHAQNAAFELLPNGHSGRLAYADGRNPTFIDLPQRFGDGGYSRLDPGESTLRLDIVGVTVGVSTASQHWGPARDHPIILGNNAGGYLHGFVGTATPLDLWVAKLHGRMVWGRLEQSAFTNITGIWSRRFMSGAVVLISPRALDGLELGMGRFYHIPWPMGGLGSEHFARPLEAFLKERRGPQTGGADAFSTVENQLASVFARWVFPRSGFEVYGEFGRNDHNWDLRDFILEPDHDSAYMLGFQKAWNSRPRMTVLHGELLNARITHLSRVRSQVPIYRHTGTRQGHTQRGQVLGSAAAYGGDGAVLGIDLYHPGGRWSFDWRRTLRHERGVRSGALDVDPHAVDVIHSIGVESLIFRGRFDIAAGLRAAENLNRNHSSDVFNLNATIGVRGGL
jgi:hypothetical protein